MVVVVGIVVVVDNNHHPMTPTVPVAYPWTAVVGDIVVVKYGPRHQFWVGVGMG